MRPYLMLMAGLVMVGLPAMAYPDQMPVYLRVSGNREAVMDAVRFADAVVLESNRNGLLVRGPDRLVSFFRDRNLFVTRLVSNPALPRSPEAFPDEVEVGKVLQELAATYPTLAEYSVIGMSVDGRPLHALRIHGQGVSLGNVPEVRLLGTHHGDELMASSLLLRMATLLLESYGLDENLTALVDGLDIHVVPIVNPDGRAALNRENSNGVDLNRNYGYQHQVLNVFGDLEIHEPFSEPEVRAVVNQHLGHNFVASLSFHSYEELVMSVWNYREAPSLDGELLQALGDAYADQTCLDGDCYDAMTGFELYPTYGDTNDFSYGTTGDMDFTVETLKEDIDKEWNRNRAGMLAFFEDVRLLPSGRILTASGSPVWARVSCGTYGAVYTHPESGRFFKALPQGTHACTAWWPGHAEVAFTMTVPMTLPLDVVATDAPGPFSAFMVVQVTTTCEHALQPRCVQEGAPQDTLGPSDGVEFHMPAESTLVLQMPASPNADVRSLQLVCKKQENKPFVVEYSDDYTGPWQELGQADGPVWLAVPQDFANQGHYIRLRTLTGGALSLDAVMYSLDEPDAHVSDGVADEAEVLTDAQDATDGLDVPVSASEVTAAEDASGKVLMVRMAGSGGCQVGSGASGEMMVTWLMLAFLVICVGGRRRGSCSRAIASKS